MKKKNYEQAFNDLIKCLHKNTKNAKCVTALQYLVNEYKGEIDLKEIITKDYAKFLSFWFLYLKESSKTSKKMQNYLLNKRFVIPDPCKWFENINFLFTKDKHDEKRMYAIISHNEAIIKALIQTQRRKLGFDKNSNKY